MSQAAWRTRCDAYLDVHVLHSSNNTCSPSPAQVNEEVLDTSLELLLQRIPKVDLHCHLNGSISHALLTHLERLKQILTNNNTVSVFSSDYAIAEAEKVIKAAECRTPAERMHACFATFDRIYGLMDNLAFTRLAVQDLLFCSAAECILVLEIRTSLRDGLRANWTTTTTSDSTTDDIEGHVTKEDYLRTVCSTVEHLLAGGVVDFRTGTLLTLQDITNSESDACATTWWADFAHIYHFLLPFLSEKREVKHKACPSTLSSLYKQLLAQLQHHLQECMHVRLLVSINRGQSVDAAYEAVKLARHLQRTQVHAFYTLCTSQYDTIKHEESERREVVHTGEVWRRLRHTCWLTGVDFSGNCYKNHFNDFVPALHAARDAFDETTTQSTTLHTTTTNTECDLPCSLAVTVHGAEKVDEEELRAMCDFAPDRWGHLVFTEDSLREAILTSYAPIELCMTSNLITCGHVGPRQHHIGPLLQHWWSIVNNNNNVLIKPITLVDVICRSDCEEDEREDSHVGENNTSGYACTERLRCARRLWRWQKQKNAFSTVASSSSAQCSAVLPNVSFHTDDRGVFASTLSHELTLLAQHPCFCTHNNEEVNNVQSSSMRDVLMTMWALQRLALLQVFELPWPALLLAHWLHKAVRDCSSKAEQEEENAGDIEIVIDKAFPATWADFVSYCHTLWDASHEGTHSGNSSQLLVQLSRWEWQWLTRAFDTYP